MSPWRSWSTVSTVSRKVMLGSPWSYGWSARATRARKRAAKARSGSIGVGAVRSASNGSGTVGVLLFRVGAAERQPRADEQRFGGVQGTVEDLGDVRDGQVVQVAQRQHRAVLRREFFERFSRADSVEVHLPRVLCLVLDLCACECPKAPFLATQASPVIDQLVARDAQQPAS